MNTLIDITGKMLSLTQLLSKYDTYNDLVTPLIHSYSEMNADGYNASFHVEDGYLHLLSDVGFMTVPIQVSEFESGVVYDLYSLYAFSPLYRDMPSTLDGIYDMFEPVIKDRERFLILIDEAISSEQWNIEEILTTMSSNTMIQSLERAIVKAHIFRCIDDIMSICKFDTS